MNSFKFKSALLIDDNQIDNLINKKILENNLFAEKIVVAGSAEVALNYLKNESPENTPDVIFLDMQLGVESGPAVARRLRKLGAAARIVALSASNSDETSSEALASGCDTFLSKPVDFDRLKELMQEDGWIR